MTKVALIKWSTLIACLAVLLAVPIARNGHQINTDAAWFIVASGRMLGGESLLGDIFEINMPLATALYLPVHAIVRVIDSSALDALLIWTLLLTLHSVLLIGLVSSSARRAGDLPWFDGLCLTWTAFVLCFLPGYDFAEREHFMVLLSLPFLWMLATRGHGVSPWLRFYVSLVAAAGFYAKPHFALLPFVLVLLFPMDRSVSTPRSRLKLRPEWVALLGGGLANTLFVVVLYPEWFEVAAWAGDLYGRFRDLDPDRFVRAGSFATTVACTSAVVISAILMPYARRAAILLLVCCTYSLLTFWLQGKGWRYQLLPALLIPSALLPWLVSLQPRSWFHTWKGLLAGGVALTMSGWLLLHAEILRRHAPNMVDLRSSPIGEALSITRPGDSISAISISGHPFLPAVIHKDLEWGSRFSALWPLIALARDVPEGNPELSGDGDLYRRYGESFSGMVADDLRTRTPDIVLVDVRSTRRQGLPARFDLVAFLSRNAEFRSEWSRYQQIGASGSFEIFARSQSETPSD